MHFIRTDCSLLSNVDVACREIQAQEPKINLLFMTPGFLSMKGRQGIDRGPHSRPGQLLIVRPPEASC